MIRGRVDWKSERKEFGQPPDPVPGAPVGSVEDILHFT
jgi:hypothetical protein